MINTIKASDDQVRFGSGSGQIFLNAEPEPAFGSRESLNPEPEPQVQVQQVRFKVRTHSNPRTA
jgi:hypothetical protein